MSFHSVPIAYRNTVILFLVGLVIYIPLLAKRLDGNDIIELRAIEAGGVELISQNHLMYRPIVGFFYGIMQSFGYNGRSALVAQHITALSAAIVLAFFHLWVSGFIKSQTASVSISIAFGTSWAYWFFATSAHYFIPSLTGILISLVLTWQILNQLEDTISYRLLILIGILTGISILLFQAHVFFTLIIICILAYKYWRSWAKIVESAMVYLLSAGFITLAGYVIASVIALNTEQQTWSLEAFIDWAFNYGGGTRLEIWGRLDADRIPAAAHSFVSSILPVWQGLGLRDALMGHIRAEKILPLLSVLGLFGLMVLPLVQYLLYRIIPDKAARNTLMLLAVILFFYVPFFLWWDPFEVRWFIIHTVPFWAAIGVLWANSPCYARASTRIVLVTLVLVIMLANFFSTIWKRATTPDPNYAIAECISANLAERDVFVTVEWAFSGHIDYYFKRQVYSLINEARIGVTGETIINQLSEVVRQVQESGGNVYIAEPSSLREDHLVWLAELTNVTKADLDRVVGQFAFACEDTSFVRIERIRK